MTNFEHIGKYRVIRQLGAGGFGAVYLCRDPHLERDVAIKLFQVRDENVARLAVSEGTDAREVLRARFVGEARVLRDLNTCSYIVPVFEFNEMEDGSPYYVMPYLADNLLKLIGKDAMDPSVIAELKPEERPRKLPVERTMTVLHQLLEALKEVHRVGLVHRDIKPANLLFNAKEEVQLCDFGIAKLPEGRWSQSGVAMGSRDYMSPEQRESAKHVDARTDVYAVGVLAYRMLTGELPVGRYRDPIEHVPQIGKGINDLIVGCLSQNRDGRPRDGADTLARFEEAQSGKSPLLEEDMTEISTVPASDIPKNSHHEVVTEIGGPEGDQFQQGSVLEAPVSPWAAWREPQADASANRKTSQLVDIRSNLKPELGQNVEDAREPIAKDRTIWHGFLEKHSARAKLTFVISVIAFIVSISIVAPPFLLRACEFVMICTVETEFDYGED